MPSANNNLPVKSERASFLSLSNPKITRVKTVKKWASDLNPQKLQKPFIEMVPSR